MAKRKDAIALFEAIQKSRQKRTETQMTVPQWMGRNQAGGAEAAPEAGEVGAVSSVGAASGAAASAVAAAPSAPAMPAAVVMPPPIASSPAGPSPAAASHVATSAAQRSPLRPLRMPGAAAPAGEPIVSLAGERLRVSLNYVSCAIVIGVVVLLLIGSFALGWMGGKGAGKPVAASEENKVPYNPKVAAGLGDRDKAAAAAATLLASPRAKGKFYLVIESLAGAEEKDRLEGNRICQFLEESGHAARLATYKHPTTGVARYIVWSMKPFDSPASDDAKSYARQIEDLGKAYLAKYHTYGFKQSSPGKKFDPWFELFK